MNGNGIKKETGPRTTGRGGGGGGGKSGIENTQWQRFWNFPWPF